MRFRFKVYEVISKTVEIQADNYDDAEEGVLQGLGDTLDSKPSTIITAQSDKQSMAESLAMALEQMQ